MTARGRLEGPIDLPPGPLPTQLGAPAASVPDAFLAALEGELGSGALRTEPEALDAAGRDWWPLAAVWAGRGRLPGRPAVVARPSDAAGVAACVRLAAEHRVPLTPAAGRSGVCGGAVPLAGGAALDLTALAGVVDVDDTSLVVRAGAGTFGDDLESALANRGFTLGHWPQSMSLSTVG